MTAQLTRKGTQDRTAEPATQVGRGRLRDRPRAGPAASRGGMLGRDLRPESRHRRGDCGHGVGYRPARRRGHRSYL
jgi:hypothetical protein